MNTHHLTSHAAQSQRRDESWGSLLWLANQQLDNADGLTLGRVIIKRGHSNPRHRHPNCEEVLYLLSGQLQHTLGDETFDLSAGDTLSIPAGAWHNARSVGEQDADMIVVYDSAQREFELENR